MSERQAGIERAIEFAGVMARAFEESEDDGLPPILRVIGHLEAVLYASKGATLATSALARGGMSATAIDSHVMTATSMLSSIAAAGIAALAKMPADLVNADAAAHVAVTLRRLGMPDLAKKGD